MSPECYKIIQFICTELSGMTHVHKQVIYGAYDAAIKNYNFIEPQEGVDYVVEKVLTVLKLMR